MTRGATQGSETIGFRVDSQLHYAIATLAAKRDVSVSQLIRDIVLRELFETMRRPG